MLSTPPQLPGHSDSKHSGATGGLVDDGLGHPLVSFIEP